MIVGKWSLQSVYEKDRARIKALVGARTTLMRATHHGYIDLGNEGQKNFLTGLI